MKKSVYESPEMKIMLFKTEEVISASIVETTTRDPKEPIELPYIPAL